MFPKYLRTLVLFVLFLFFIQSSFAQTKSKIEQKLDRLEKEHKYDSLTDLLEHLIYRQDVNQEKKNEHLQRLIGVYIDKEDYVNASTSCTKLIKWLGNKDQSKLPKIYISKSRAEFFLGKPKEAEYFGKQAYEISKKLKDSVYMTKSLVVLGILKEEEDDSENALKYYREAKRVNKISEQQSSLYNNLCVVFHSLGNMDSSIYYSKKSIESLKKMKPVDDPAIISAYGNLGATYINMQQYKKGLQYLDSTRLYDWGKSTHKNIERILANYYTTYFTLNDFDKGRHYLLNYIRHHETVFWEKMQSEIKELEIMHEKETKLLEERQQAKIDQLMMQKIILSLIIGFLIFIILAIFIAFRNNRRKTKAINDKIKVEQRLLRTQMNPHFILNALAAIQTHVEDKNEKAAKYLNDFAKLMQITLENSRENFISVESEIKALEKYLSLQLMRFEEEFEYEIRSESSVDVTEILIPPMIIQPFVENCIHHGIRNIDRKGKINISLSVKNEVMQCVIEDNGSGLTKDANHAKKKKSLSTQIVRERLEILSAELKKEASVQIIDKQEQGESGVKVVLTIPFTY